MKTEIPKSSDLLFLLFYRSVRMNGNNMKQNQPVFCHFK